LSEFWVVPGGLNRNYLVYGVMHGLE